MSTTREKAMPPRYASTSHFTIWDKLCDQLGREPTDAEVKAAVRRIMADAGARTGRAP